MLKDEDGNRVVSRRIYINIIIIRDHQGKERSEFPVLFFIQMVSHSKSILLSASFLHVFGRKSKASQLHYVMMILACSFAFTENCSSQSVSQVMSEWVKGVYESVHILKAERRKAFLLFIIPLVFHAYFLGMMKRRKKSYCKYIENICLNGKCR